MTEENRPLVGIGIIVVKDNKVFLGKRKGDHGNGTWSTPGGHLEFMEDWESGALRELDEESDLQVESMRFVGITNDFFPAEHRHYVTIFMLADYVSGTDIVKEPDKWEVWQWFEWADLPQPLFVPVQNLVDSGYCPLLNQ